MSSRPPTPQGVGPDRTDADLCEAIRSGADHEGMAVTELYRRHHGPAIAYARRLTGGSSISDDLVAEAFLKTWQRLAGGQDVTGFRSYLTRAVHNSYIDALRQRSRLVALEGPVAAVHPALTVGDRSASVDDADLARALFEQLIPRHRHVIWLQAVEGYTTAEIASALGIKANAAAVLLHRARKALTTAYHELHEPVAA